MNVLKKSLRKAFVRQGDKFTGVSIRCSKSDKQKIKEAAKSVGSLVSAYLLRLHRLATEDE